MQGTEISGSSLGSKRNTNSFNVSNEEDDQENIVLEKVLHSPKKNKNTEKNV